MRLTIDRVPFTARDIYRAKQSTVEGVEGGMVETGGG